jgi:hypothetical protein
MTTPTTKYCGNCKIEKPISDFIKLKNGVIGIGGYHSQCRSCNRTRYNEWRRKNPKKHAERNSKWFYDNHEISLARQKVYRVRIGAERNRRRVGEHDRNAKKNCARTRAWKKANPERARVLEHNREARKRKLPCTWTVEQMNYGLAHWGNCCPVCGIDLDGKRHWDHWIPLICDTCPGTVASNMVPLCGRCNTRKNDSMPDAWLQRLFPTTWQQIKQRVEAYLKTLV